MVQRHVGVAPERAFFHLDVGDTEPAHDVAQLGDVGASHDRGEGTGADHGLGDNLDQGDAGTVVVDERVVRPVDATGRTTGMGELAGVLLHVHALDLDAEDLRAIIGRDGDVEVAVDADRLVVLADLVVLRHIGVEVVLAGHAAPLDDVAVERQPDADDRLDGLGIGHRQGAGQAKTDGAHLRVGRGAEIGRAAAEHLGAGAEFDVHLEADDRIELRDRVVEGNGRRHSAGTSSMSRCPQRSRSAASRAPPTR